MNVQCGRVSSADFDEIVVCTRLGWVFALTTEPIDTLNSTVALSPQVEVKVQQLRYSFMIFAFKLSRIHSFIVLRICLLM